MTFDRRAHISVQRNGAAGSRIDRSILDVGLYHQIPATKANDIGRGNRIGTVHKAHRLEGLLFLILVRKSNIDCVRHIVAIRIHHLGQVNNGPGRKFFDIQLCIGNIIIELSRCSSRLRKQSSRQDFFGTYIEHGFAVHQLNTGNRNRCRHGTPETNVSRSRSQFNRNIHRIQKLGKRIQQVNMDFNPLGVRRIRGPVSCISILVESEESLFQRRGNGINFHIATHHGASAVVLILPSITRQTRNVIVPAYPFHIVIAISKGRILVEHIRIRTRSVVINKILRFSIHLQVIQISCRSNLAIALVSSLVIFFFNRIIGTHERLFEIKSNRTMYLRTIFRRIIWAITKDMLTMVIDRHIGVTSKCNNRVALAVYFQVSRFGQIKVRSILKINSFEIFRITIGLMRFNRPPIFKVLKRSIFKLKLEDHTP